MIAGYLGRTDRSDAAIADYAVAYANEIERDYKDLDQRREERREPKSSGNRLEMRS